MATAQVRIWRPAGEERVLLMAGRTSSYAIEPRGEYVFGIVEGQPMRSRRGRERRLVRPASSSPGIPRRARGRRRREPWSSRLMIVETAGLASLAGDDDEELRPEVCFPRSGRLRPELAGVPAHARRARVRRHAARARRAARRLAARARRAPLAAPSLARALPGRDERALRLARDYLADRLDRNVGLDELAAAAGIGSSAWSGWCASGPACRRTRCSSRTGCRRPAAGSRPASRSRRPRSRPASPTRATCTATSCAASG